jgi:3-deoxy-D-arabino-heptulosonate 7-phosphate (DAHP) synthase
VIGVVKDHIHINEDIRSRLKALPGVEALVRITRFYKLDSREFHPIDTVVNKKGVKIGGGNAPVVISRPCSVESEEQFIPTVIAVKVAGTDGLLIEVHSNPDQTMSDGPQSVIFEPCLHFIDGVRSVTGAGSDNRVPLRTQPVGI